MQHRRSAHRNRVSRRTMLAATAALAASPALSEECRIGPSPHPKGPPVFMDYDQVELDAAYDQRVYEPMLIQVAQRLAANSEATRRRIGAPLRAAYGSAEIEKLDIYRASRTNAPVFVYIHGGVWQWGSAADSGFAAETLVNAGAHYVALDFSSVTAVGGDLGVLAAQVRRGIAWVYNNADSFGGDRSRIYVGGHSSGGHLCGVALTTEWEKEFGIPEDVVKGGLCMSGMYEMTPVRLSWRRNFISFTDAMADAMSPQRHVDKLNAPVVVSYGTLETPEFRRQSRDFAALVKAAAKEVTLIEAPYCAHLDMAESLGNPYGPNGRAALAMMRLAPGRS
jgi:arylformamidase